MLCQENHFQELGEKMKPDTKIITRLSQSAHSKYQYIYCWCIDPKLESSGPKLPLSCQIKVHFCSKCAANLGLPLWTSYVLGQLNFGNILHRAGRVNKNKGSSAALLECSYLTARIGIESLKDLCFSNSGPCDFKKEVFTCGRAVTWVACHSISPLLGIARQRKHTGQVAVGRRAGRQDHLLLRLLLRHHRRPWLGGRTTDATMATWMFRIGERLLMVGRIKSAKCLANHKVSFWRWTCGAPIWKLIWDQFVSG